MTYSGTPAAPGNPEWNTGTYQSQPNTGVDPARRGRGLGTALLLASLWGLADLGYAYGIIGAAGPVEFYQKAVGAIVIPDSTPGTHPGVYADLLR